jgi:hypothetical protein
LTVATATAADAPLPELASLTVRAEPAVSGAPSAPAAFIAAFMAV